MKVHFTSENYEREILVPRNETLHLVDVVYGDAKGNTLVKLEENASLISETLTLGKNSVKVKAIHLGKKSNSKIVSKNLVNNTVTFIAKTVINKEAEDSKTEQLIDSLMLNPEAKINALPLLDIKNSEVSASHGATIGTLDAELLFYMRSRGLNCKQAKQTMIDAYLDPFRKYFNEEQLQKIEVLQ